MISQQCRNLVCHLIWLHSVMVATSSLIICFIIHFKVQRLQPDKQVALEVSSKEIDGFFIINSSGEDL